MKIGQLTKRRPHNKHATGCEFQLHSKFIYCMEFVSICISGYIFFLILIHLLFIESYFIIGGQFMVDQGNVKIMVTNK